ncbi:hypothetical protein [Microbulbifer guangxiensis]|uniref:hypothetical protein n=1 Tax=Microbulbifer guangxiensis TaxID=2904249 RepID=UPI001F20550F|nr:hypothetical protein [Microbulbifer guangxiensis]
MRTLYLHIGFHKTGSTSLQLALSRARAQLAAEGFEFISLGKKGNSSGAIDVRKTDGQLSFSLNDRFAELLASSRSDRVIVSAEHLSFLHEARQVEEVCRLCRQHFERTIVIVYLRRQDRQAISFKQQAARGCERDRSSSSKLLGHESGALPALTDDVRTYYDYCAKLRLWADSFGKESLRVRRFNAADLEGRDIVTDFASLLGLSTDLDPCRINESVSRKEFLLSHRLIELGLEPRQLKKLKPWMKQDKSRLKPARERAVDFFSHFAESNRALDREFLSHPSGLGFSDDFTSYPETGNDHLLLSDLAEWEPDFFKVGLQDPRALRDALVIEPLNRVVEAAGPESKTGRELAALKECLGQTAAVWPEGKGWWARLRRRKRDGR